MSDADLTHPMFDRRLHKWQIQISEDGGATWENCHTVYDHEAAVMSCRSLRHNARCTGTRYRARKITEPKPPPAGPAVQGAMEL